MTSRIAGDPEIDPGPPGGTDSSDGHIAASEAPMGHREDFDSLVEEIRRRLASLQCTLFPYLGDRIRRRLGLAPMGIASLAVAGLVAVGVRLAVALVAAGLAGGWTEIPWVRWTPILLFFLLFDGTQSLRMPPLDAPLTPRLSRVAEEWMALLPTIVRTTDLQELDGFVRRWYRPAVSTPVAAAVAATMLLTAWLFSPDGMSGLSPGTLVLLGFVLYGFGESVYMANIFIPAFMAREARCDHHLFWPSPVDSPEVQKALRMTTIMGFFAIGFWITVYLVLAVYLVSWDSPVVVPLAVGFLVVGYLSTIASGLSMRGSIQRIVERVRRRRLEGLQRRIETFGPRYTELSPQESQQLRDLLDLHTTIRDAPAAPSTGRTVAHSAVGLIIPTIIFILTVFGEVYAERTFDTLLP